MKHAVVKDGFRHHPTVKACKLTMSWRYLQQVAVCHGNHFFSYLLSNVLPWVLPTFHVKPRLYKNWYNVRPIDEPLARERKWPLEVTSVPRVSELYNEAFCDSFTTQISHYIGCGLTKAVHHSLAVHQPTIYARATRYDPYTKWWPLLSSPTWLTLCRAHAFCVIIWCGGTLQ